MYQFAAFNDHITMDGPASAWPWICLSAAILIVVAAILYIPAELFWTRVDKTVASLGVVALIALVGSIVVTVNANMVGNADVVKWLETEHSLVVDTGDVNNFRAYSYEREIPAVRDAEDLVMITLKHGPGDTVFLTDVEPKAEAKKE